MRPPMRPPASPSPYVEIRGVLPSRESVQIEHGRHPIPLRHVLQQRRHRYRVRMQSKLRFVKNQDRRKRVLRLQEQGHQRDEAKHPVRRLPCIVDRVAYSIQTGGEVRSVLLEQPVILNRMFTPDPRRKGRVVKLIHHNAFQQPTNETGSPVARLIALYNLRLPVAGPRREGSGRRGGPPRQEGVSRNTPARSAHPSAWGVTAYE